MKHYIILASVLFICTVVIASECPVITEADLQAETKLFQGQRSFLIDFLKTASEKELNQSFFFSPYSIYRALLLVYVGSNGKTETAMRNYLNLEWSHDKNEVLNEYKHEKTKRLENAKLETELEFESVDKLFFDKKADIKECVKKSFSDEIELVEIKHNEMNATKYMNDWVEQTTRGNIKDLIPILEKNTKLVAANAAYFKGLWKQKFDASKTVKEDFHRSEDTIALDMMKLEGKFRYDHDEDLGYKAIQLPYKTSKHGKVSFIAILPIDEGEFGIRWLINNLTTDNFENVLAIPHKSKVNVWLPKFIHEYSLNLKNVLQKMGFRELFSTAVDFTDFSETEDIYIDDAFHKAKIEVDESGSIAAAGTALIGRGKKILQQELTFHANRPFLYMIYDRKIDVVLFAGVYRGPEYDEKKKSRKM